MDLFTIQFESLEPVVTLLMVQTPPLEIKPTVNIPEDDQEGVDPCYSAKAQEPKARPTTAPAPKKEIREEKETSVCKG